MVRVGVPCALLGAVAGASAHGAVSFPPPRQAIDSQVAPWNGSVPAFPIPFDKPNWCTRPSSSVADSRNVTSNGQACFWYNNGCDIGSGKCDGVTGQKIPFDTKFRYTGSGSPPSWGAEGIVVDPAFVASFDRDAVRPKYQKYPERKATLCDPRLRGLNTQAACGSAEDFWYNAPWRYPGVTTIHDSCGSAGGVLPHQPAGTAGADYTNTEFAQLGDLGSRLPPMPTGTVWVAGSDVEVGWTQKAWHGGGYQYRLCPTRVNGYEVALNEDCFQKLPLAFVGNSSLRWGGEGGERLYFNTTERGWDVSTGTIPEGSTWRKNPLPRGPWGWRSYGPSFEPVCEETEACRTQTMPPPGGVSACRCSGDGVCQLPGRVESNCADLPQLEIVDTVHIPDGLAPGDYVLGWRWDCEESTQVWTSCSDVTIKMKTPRTAIV